MSAAPPRDPRDTADAALNRAEITYLAGDRGRASELIGQATEDYQRKGATAYTARARRLATQWTSRDSPAPDIAIPHPPTAEGRRHN